VAWRAIRHYNSGGWLRGANPRGCLGGDIWAIADGISKPDARKSPPPGKVLVINSAVDVPVGNDASVNEAAVKTYAVSLGSPGSNRGGERDHRSGGCYHQYAGHGTSVSPVAIQFRQHTDGVYTRTP
jgi:hypothetical protein